MVGPHADWLAQPEEAWELLSVDNYNIRAPRVPLSELEASAVMLAGRLILLHKRRCTQTPLAGQVAVPWCQHCSSHLGQKPPRMPAARRTETESFPPASLGGSFIALFVGSDVVVEHGLFG